MKKKIIIVTTCILVILSSFSFAFADDQEDYSWLIGKTITLNDVLSPFYYQDLNVLFYDIIFTSDDLVIGGIQFFNARNEFLYAYDGAWHVVYDFTSNSWADNSFKDLTIYSIDFRSSSVSSPYYLASTEQIIQWLFNNSNAGSFRPPVPPQPSFISELIQPVVGLLSSARSGISSFFEFVSNAFEDIYSIPAVFPSLWALVPSSITSVYLGIFVIVTFMGILKFLLSK